MTITPSTETGHSGPGNRRRWMAIAIVVVIIVGLAVAFGMWWYFYGQPAPAAPTIDNALQQLLPTDAPG